MLLTVCQSTQNRWDNLGQVRMEANAECRWQEDEERHETFAHVRARACRAVNNIGEETFHALDPKPGQNFRKSLCSTLSIDTWDVAFECSQEVLDEVRETILAQALDKTAKCLCSGGTSFGYRVREDRVNEWHEAWQIRNEVLRVGERRHVADDLSCLLLGLCTTLLHSTLDNGDDLKGERSNKRGKKKRKRTHTKASDDESI